MCYEVFSGHAGNGKLLVPKIFCQIGAPFCGKNTTATCKRAKANTDCLLSGGIMAKGEWKVKKEKKLSLGQTKGA